MNDNCTMIPNDFLDKCLPDANGDFLKVYLYVRSAVSRNITALSTGAIADVLNCTNNDVARALEYWVKARRLQYSADGDGNLSDISFADGAECGEPSDVTMDKAEELAGRKDVRDLLSQAQYYLGRPMSMSELQDVCFFCDNLRLPPETIMHLFRTSAERGKFSFPYMRKIAMRWARQGIRSVEAAKSDSPVRREHYEILRLLGIRDRAPADAETELMDKWLTEYNYPMDVIREACNRAIANTGRPGLKYVDAILSKWKEKGIAKVSDVDVLDRPDRRRAGPGRIRPVGCAAFNDFEQRAYDYDAIEKRLLRMELGIPEPV